MSRPAGAVLSAVVSRRDEAMSLAPLVASLHATMTGVPVELLVTGATEPSMPPLPDDWQCRWLPTDRAMLVPDQWGSGLRAATAPLVGFFTPDLLPTPGWWPTLEPLIGVSGVAGAAGGIALGTRAMPAAGVFLTRYSRFFPRDQGRPEAVDHLPGEVSIYRRETLLACPDLAARGFWEIHYHERLRSHGWRLLFSPAVLAECHLNGTSILSMMRQRSEHGQQYGSELVQRHHRSRLAVALRAPLVPLLLTVRSLRRAWGNPWGRRAIPLGLAPLLLYTIAWGYGEGIGAWRSGPPE
jgi:hypothetical protein